MVCKIEMNIIDKIRELVYLRDFVKSILSSGSESDYSIEYHLIFNEYVSKEIRNLLDDINIDLDYYDPDSSYKGDVFAYYEALNELVTELERKMGDYL